ncbi:hypothetical protein [Niabella hibiscisoli]|uniref:hypothetical protein n=1 Tax=Niabella hibiscisoli TaxID=1825928 RepID=UPI00293E19A6|nr:hypothetical protein [Niabella hibiscisoli]
MLDETLTGIRIIKAFCAEKIMNNRFVTLNNTLLGINKKWRPEEIWLHHLPNYWALPFYVLSFILGRTSS